MKSHSPASRKTAPLAAALLLAFAHSASASTYLGVNDAECYTPEVLNEELDLGYGQKPTGEMREHAGIWRSVIMYRNPEEKTWTLVGKPYEAEARKATNFERLLCIIDGGEEEDYQDNPSYRSLMLGLTPKP